MKNDPRDDILELIDDFIDDNLDGEHFVSGFLSLWRQNVRRIDVLTYEWKKVAKGGLTRDLLDRKITTKEFRQKWDDIFGVPSEEDWLLDDFIDQVMTACDVFREVPESEYELDETRLREFVAKERAGWLSRLKN